MAHNNDYTHIYIDKSVTPNVGIDFDEVRQALNEATLDFGKLCLSKNINLWARYRFIPNDPYPDTIIKDAERVRGSGNNGRVVQDMTTLDVFNDVDFIPSQQTPYAPWVSFRGMESNTNGAYRVFDFDGYNALAPSPFQSLDVPPEHHKGKADAGAAAGYTRVSISINQHAQQYENSVKLQDFIIFDQRWYLGFVFFQVQNDPDFPAAHIATNKRMITQTTQLQIKDAMPLQLYLDVPDAFIPYTGKWRVYAVLCSRSHPGPQPDTGVVGTFYTLPFEYAEIEIIEDDEYKIVLGNESASYSTGNRTITVSFEVQMYRYDDYTGTESYVINGMCDDGTWELLKSDRDDGTWPIPLPVGGVATRSFNNLQMDNLYWVNQLGTAERVYKQYSQIEIIYSRGSKRGTIIIRRDA